MSKRSSARHQCLILQYASYVLTAAINNQYETARQSLPTFPCVVPSQVTPGSQHCLYISAVILTVVAPRAVSQAVLQSQNMYCYSKFGERRSQT